MLSGTQLVQLQSLVQDDDRQRGLGQGGRRLLQERQGHLEHQELRFLLYLQVDLLHQLVLLVRLVRLVRVHRSDHLYQDYLVRRRDRRDRRVQGLQLLR